MIYNYTKLKLFQLCSHVLCLDFTFLFDMNSVILENDIMAFRCTFYYFKLEERSFEECTWNI